MKCVLNVELTEKYWNMDFLYQGFRLEIELPELMHHLCCLLGSRL